MGSVGLSPVVLANRFRMSVRVMTPMRRPDRWEPGREEVDTGDEGNWPAKRDDCEVDDVLGVTTVGPSSGVAGAEGDGDADSTTHILWDCVATNLATVCASVE